MREQLAAKGNAPRRCLSSPNISRVRTFPRFCLAGFFQCVCCFLRLTCTTNPLPSCQPAVWSSFLLITSVTLR